MTNLRAIQKNYYPPRFVRSAWYLLIRSSWSFDLAFERFLFFGTGGVAQLAAAGINVLTIDSRGHGESGGLKVGGKAGRLINTLWREILREGSQPEPSRASGRTSKRSSKPVRN